MLVPRLLFDKWSQSDFHAIFSNENAMNDLVSSVVNFIKVDLCASYATILYHCMLLSTHPNNTFFFQAHNFDGVVLEVWVQFLGDSRQ